jgi:hypothetical protein
MEIGMPTSFSLFRKGFVKVCSSATVRFGRDSDDVKVSPVAPELDVCLMKLYPKPLLSHSGVEKFKYAFMPAQKDSFDTPGNPGRETVEKEMLVLAIGVRGNARTTIEVTTPKVPGRSVSVTHKIGEEETHLHHLP